jgi:hypothetical protein
MNENAIQLMPARRIGQKIHEVEIEGGLRGAACGERSELESQSATSRKASIGVRSQSHLALAHNKSRRNETLVGGMTTTMELGLIRGLSTSHALVASAAVGCDGVGETARR